MHVELPSPVRVATGDLDRELTEGTRIPTATGDFRVGRLLLTEGASRDVELLVIDAPHSRVAICPTRGMSLWRARLAGVACGWQSPVEGPIHPSLVALDESTGLGWLDGFDELLVRCGLRDFGAPEWNGAGQLVSPLHGRIGNLPARRVRLDADFDHGLLHVLGDVHETRFLQYDLRLQVRYTLAIDQPIVRVRDVVTNASARPSSMRLLYHINVGAPLLESGARLHVAARTAVARNRHAARDLADWATYQAPTAGYSEQVYFFDTLADTDGWASALLASPGADRGFAVHFRTDTLPCFTQWKNTVDVRDGYVTGLEPGTGYPNPRAFEESRRRVVGLQPGESRAFELRLEGIGNGARTAALIQEIDGRRKGAPIATCEFDPDRCLPE